jgi:hypothetical protein
VAETAGLAEDDGKRALFLTIAAAGRAPNRRLVALSPRSAHEPIAAFDSCLRARYDTVKVSALAT